MIREKNLRPSTEAKGVAKSVAPAFVIGTIVIIGYALFVRKVILKE